MTDTRVRDDVAELLNVPDRNVPGGGEISRTMIWDFAACLQDANPAYWDEDWAANSRFGGLIAPPAMLMTHSRYPQGAPGTAAEWEPDYLKERARKFFPELGFGRCHHVTARVRELGPYPFATNARRREEYFEAVRPGDRLLANASVEVSAEKRTWLGSGVYITTTADYHRESDDVRVARAVNVLYVYNRENPKPRPETEARTPTASITGEQATPSEPPMETVRFDDVVTDTALPRLIMKLDWRSLMLAAQGTRHPVAIHTDREYARAAGNRDAYFATLWQAGLLGRFATDWAGPEAFLRACEFSMTGNICPGDTIAVTGEITDKHPDGSCVDVNVRIENEHGPTTSGVLTIELA